jgi:hypothetical protein
VPEKVPLWVLQNTFATFGRRMPPRGDTLGSDFKVCETCHVEIYNIRDWHYCDGNEYCNKCIEAARKAASEKWERERLERKAAYERVEQGRHLHGGWRPGAVTALPPAVPMTEAQVPLGNLNEADYQYWVGTLSEPGYMHVVSQRAVCRACGEVVYGSMGRAIHKRDSVRYYNDGHTCMKVIAMAIREMVSLYNCSVCRTYTNKKHYGVPICSPNCHKIWRFNDKQQYPELDQRIAPYWMSTTDIPVIGGSSTSESMSSQIWEAEEE